LLRTFKIKMKNEIKNILGSKSFKVITFIVGVIAVSFLIFQIGMMAGFRKASFGCNWSNHYAENFGFPERMGPSMMKGEFGDFGNLPNAHGAIGKIIKVELPIIVVSDEKDNNEKIILIDEKTEIRKARNKVTQDELKVDEHVVIMGDPNSSGQIEARLIRFIPAPFEPSITNN